MVWTIQRECALSWKPCVAVISSSLHALQSPYESPSEKLRLLSFVKKLTFPLHTHVRTRACDAWGEELSRWKSKHPNTLVLSVGVGPTARMLARDLKVNNEPGKITPKKPNKTGGLGDAAEAGAQLAGLNWTTSGCWAQQRPSACAHSCLFAW